VGDPDRGERDADGGYANVEVHYPDPELIAMFHNEWQHKLIAYTEEADRG